MARLLKRSAKAKPRWELESVMFIYSGSTLGSRIVRGFVESGMLSEYARNNPQIRFDAKHKNAKPHMIGYYSKRISSSEYFHWGRTEDGSRSTH